MRVLVLLLVLLSMPVLAADYDYTPWPDTEQAASCELQLAQAQMPSGQVPSGQLPGSSSGGQSGGSSSGGASGGSLGGGQSPSGPQVPQRYPGDYCCKHCRHNEIPCGDTCVSKATTKVCQAKKTCACPGKP